MGDPNGNMDDAPNLPDDDPFLEPSIAFNACYVSGEPCRRKASQAALSGNRILGAVSGHSSKTGMHNFFGAFQVGRRMD